LSHSANLQFLFFLSFFLFFFFSHGYSVSPSPCVDKTVFSLLNSLGSRVKIDLTIYVKIYFWVPCSITSICMSSLIIVAL
jgi:hypothetical protein